MFTTVLDTFNRANESPLSGGGNWTARAEGGTAKPMQLTSNQAAATTSAQAYAAWNPLGGALTDCEVFATISGALTDRNIVMLHIQGSVATDNIQGIALRYSSGALDLSGYNNTTLQSFGSFSITLAAGDKIGLTCTAGTIKAYTFQSGTWTQRISVAQSTFSAPYNSYTSGYIGMSLRGTTTRLDDFGGGGAAASAAELVGAVQF